MNTVLTPKPMARAIRRHHRQRLRAARRTYWGREGADSLNPLFLGKVLQTPTLCSGPCCGNPRRWFGQPTVAERRQFERGRDLD